MRRPGEIHMKIRYGVGRRTQLFTNYFPFLFLLLFNPFFLSRTPNLFFVKDGMKLINRNRCDRGFFRSVLLCSKQYTQRYSYTRTHLDGGIRSILEDCRGSEADIELRKMRLNGASRYLNTPSFIHNEDFTPMIRLLINRMHETVVCLLGRETLLVKCCLCSYSELTVSRFHNMRH